MLMVLLQGQRIILFVSPWSTITIMESKDLLGGRSEVHGDLLKRAGAVGCQGKERRDGGVGVDLVRLADGAASDVFTNVGGHSWPPVVPLK